MTVEETAEHLGFMETTSAAGLVIDPATLPQTSAAPGASRLAVVNHELAASRRSERTLPCK